MKASENMKEGYKDTIVSNQRWVHCNQLVKGMYVCELDVAWENTPFMFQGFFLESQEQIDTVAQYSEYALVKTEKVALRAVRSTY